jgi:diguanylate cyclase (GGDEF)-like protein
MAGSPYLRRYRSRLRGLADAWMPASPGRYRLPDQPLADPLADPLQRAAGYSYMVLKETDPPLLRERLVAATLRLFDADVARLLEPSASGELQSTLTAGDRKLPATAYALEPELARRAVIAGKSLISDHPRLYPELRPLADDARRDGVLTHAMLIRAHGKTHGAVAVHWLGRDRPDYEARRGVYWFWDNVGLALATSNERQRLAEELARLDQIAHYDELTGLPNQHLLIRELDQRLTKTDPTVVLYVDFDGMREANNSLGYDEGGDVLIRTVAHAIPAFLRPGELAARVHRAGDEFACVLESGSDALERARALERALDGLDVPHTLRPYYRGASVGYATSGLDDTSGELLARAAASMSARKQQRRTDRPGG